MEVLNTMEFLINHTTKNIQRIVNVGHCDIANELRKLIDTRCWKLTDTVELLIYQNCDTGYVAELILNQNYVIDRDYEKWFVY